MMERRVRLCLAVLLAAAVAGCGSQKEAAFRTFSEAYSCPRERMTVAPVKDVTMRDLWLRANPLPEPPADVRADPARLAVWRRAQDKEREGPLRGVESYELFRVSGCGQAVDYACYCPPQRTGATQGSGSRQDFCGCEDPPAPIPQGGANDA